MKAASGAKGKCDVLFSKIVRRGGRCVICGRTETIQCAHVISRRYSNTRCDEQNAVCLCAKHHLHFTINPVEWGKWVMEHIGEDAYEGLWVKAQSLEKVNWDRELARLRARAKELGVE